MFFIHRVKGLAPGLYLMPRTAGAEERLRSVLSEDLSWTAVKEAPKHFRLIRLLEEDYRRFAGVVSCRQPIAADSVFTVSMLAEFNAALDRGDWWYRYLHWEAGMLGHVLYLEAEAAGDARLSWFVDGVFLATVDATERVWWTPEAGSHEVVVTDERGRVAKRDLEVRRGR